MGKNLSCDILLKNMAGFCLYPNNLPEVKLKDNGLNQSLKLWEWSLGCTGNPKISDMQEKWDSFQGELKTGSEPSQESVSLRN